KRTCQADLCQPRWPECTSRYFGIVAANPPNACSIAKHCIAGPYARTPIAEESGVADWIADVPSLKNVLFPDRIDHFRPTFVLASGRLRLRNQSGCANVPRP